MRAKLVNYFGAFAVSALASALAFAAIPTAAGAADLGLKLNPGTIMGSCSEIVLTCENGRQYPLCPISATVTGELVTASLYTAPRRATYVRLVPMGVGYRYAGKGIWVDGLRGNAMISFSNTSSVACTVELS